MALLFIKQKLFPSWDQPSSQKIRGSREQLLKKNASSSPDLSEFPSFFHGSIHTNISGRPLLLDDSENFDGSTVDGGSDRDIEAQTPGSYSTFTGSSGDLDDASVRSSESSSRSRINPRLISDAILGLSDGLTVPFALSAGLSAMGDTKVVVIGGLAELIAGAISMGLGGYVGAKSEL
jgi:vacuolar iron transporter family protein